MFQSLRSIKAQFSPIQGQQLRFQDVLILLLLIVASYAVNDFPVNLFFGITFLFGSVGAWLALYLYGPFWGLLTGAIASAHTIILWNHPYAVIIFTMEVLTVIYWWAKKRDSIVFYDALYWLVLGIPLVLVFYMLPLGMSWQAAFTVALKQAGNGVANALLASLIVTCLPLQKIPFLKFNYLSKKAFQQVIFDILLAFIVIPVFALMIISAHDRFFKMKQDMDQTLSLPAKVIIQDIRNWERNYTQGSEIIAKLIRLDPLLGQKTLTAIEDVLKIHSEIDGISLFDVDGKFVKQVVFDAGQKKQVAINREKVQRLEALLQEYTFDNRSSTNLHRVRIPPDIKEEFNFNGMLISLNEPGYLLTEINIGLLKNSLRENLNTLTQNPIQGVFVNHRNDKVLFDTKGEQSLGTVWDWNKTKQIKPLLGETAIALPVAPFGKSAMTMWEEAFAFQMIPLKQESLEANLWLILTVKPYIQNLSQFYTSSLLIVWLLILWAIAAAAAVSRWLTLPLNQLSITTTNAHQQLQSPEAIHLPDRQILELDNLSHNFQEMLSTLQHQFRTIQDNAENLEHLVSDRTQALLQEIHERRRIEAELRQSKEIAEKANRAKSNFLATMSHELRTPLNSVLGLAESLAEEIYGPVTPKQQEMLQIIERSGVHLLELINDILNIAKVESKQIEFEFAPTDIVAVCDDALDFVQELAARKQITLKRAIAFDELVLTVDRRRLLQALINLLNNALKFTYDGGSVTLEATLQNPLALPQPTPNLNDAANGISAPALARFQTDLSPECTLCLAVIDTGIGIAKNDLEKIFEPFTQIDSELNRRYEGTGLGLALVRSIAHAHDGEVKVSTALGRGSNFSIELPCSPSTLSTTVLSTS